MKFQASSGFKLEWEGKEYSIRKPKVKEAMLFTRDFNKLDDKAFEQMELTISYLDVLGLPKAVCEDMEMDHIVAIQKMLMGVDTSGK